MKNMSQRQEMKRMLFRQMKHLQAGPKASPQEQIQSLVKQAEYYTSFLLSKFQSREKGEQQNADEAEYAPFTRLVQQPSILKGGELKYYQMVGLNWMISLYQSGISGILADDMGLGKTIQTISILAFLKQYKDISGPHLIIAPKVTLGNWVKQLEKWLPSLKTLKLEATKQQRQVGLANIAGGKFDVVVTSYEGVRIAEGKLKKIKWQYLVIDQAHKIKNQTSQLSQKVRNLQNECKLLLTGTPLQNNLHQLWSLMNFLLPQIFKSAEPFDNWMTAESQTDKAQLEKKNVLMIGQLHKILKPFMLRRTKAQVQKSLPGKKEIHLYVGLSEAQLKIYQNLLKNRNANEDQKRYYLNLLMQLRKVCCHPYLFPNVQPIDAPPLGQHIVTSCGKLTVLDQLLSKLYKEGGHKVLLFSQMTSALDILEDYCRLREYEYCRIDGGTDIKSRQSQIQLFNEENNYFIFLLSTRAGGLGINLTAANTVIIYDSDFNPQMDLQAMDRAYRIGQKRFVKVYRLITENTIQEKIIERQMIKLKWDSLVIQQQKAAQKNKALTKEEMKEMLQYGASTIFKATSNTLSQEFIEDLLSRGQVKTEAFNQKVEDQIKPPSDLNLNMDSINIFDFMQRDEQKRRRDAQAIEKAAAKQAKEAALAQQYRGRREKQIRMKIQKRVTVPQHQFYENKDRLLELLQKEEDNKNNKDMQDCPPLTQDEEKEKDLLFASGFKNWNKTDFTSFVSANEKWGRNNLQDIAATLGRPLDDVSDYSKVFWDRVDQLADGEKILKFIESGESKMENKRLQYEVLQWKKQRCKTMEFNPVTYNKFKSKLFSIDADVFIANKVLQYGSRGISKVKEGIKEESIFRFDHYLRTRNESEINKRLASIYKLLEKERQNDLYGLDQVYHNGSQYKRVRPWEKAIVQLHENKKRVKKIK